MKWAEPWNYWKADHSLVLAEREKKEHNRAFMIPDLEIQPVNQ